MKIQDLTAKQKHAWAEDPKKAFDEAQKDDDRNGWKSKEFLLKKQAKDYANNSTIHGLNYIAEHGRPISEKWVAHSG